MKILENDVDENIQCDVCLEMEYEEGDAILICDLCNAATHQTCYGSDILNGVPSGEWFCERCTTLKEN